MKENINIQKEKGAYNVEKLMRTNELCEFLGVSRITLWRWEKQGWIYPIQPFKRSGVRSAVKLYRLSDAIKQLENSSGYTHPIN